MNYSRNLYVFTVCYAPHKASDMNSDSFQTKFKVSSVQSVHVSLRVHYDDLFLSFLASLWLDICP